MTDQDHLERLLRVAFPPTTGEAPSYDLWPAVRRRSQDRLRWSRLDIGLAATVAVALWLVPQGLWLLIYHL